MSKVDESKLNHWTWCLFGGKKNLCKTLATNNFGEICVLAPAGLVPGVVGVILNNLDIDYYKKSLDYRASSDINKYKGRLAFWLNPGNHWMACEHCYGKPNS